MSEPTSTKRSGSPRWQVAAALVVAVVFVVGFGVALSAIKGSGSSDASGVIRGLPRTPDDHSLLVSAIDPNGLVLGTHYGLFQSADGGVTWRRTKFGRRDAMNLARTSDRSVVWAAGHHVLARSTDGGATWEDVSPPGLPYLDVHGFTTDPVRSDRLYAAIAGDGLYRSTDGGATFSLVTHDVGGDVFSLAVTRSGQILAGDTRHGLLSSSNGGRTWTTLIDTPVIGVAINPRQPNRILATGRIAELSKDGGRHWKLSLALNEGTGPVAWSASDPRTAYLVGLNRKLYRSSDGGENWQPVRPKESK